MLRTTGGGSPAVGQGTERFIQAIRSASEKDLMGKLNIGKLAKGIGEVDARAVEAAKHMQQTSGSIEDFNRTVGAAGTASQEFGEAVKSAVINMGAMLLVMVAIKGAMWIFDKLNVTTEEQQEILGMLLDSCKYMNAMLSSLLATYRNERGVVKLNYEEVSLTDLAEDCISEMIYIAKDKNVNISIEKRCDIPFVYGDKVQIKRVIMNLLSNGIKYAFKDTEIKIKIYNEINLTCFSLENRSPYIPAEKREAIFAQYVSFAEAHKELGIGLGLYTSKKIVNAHAGSIFVESYEDERTIFGFKIPNVKDSICAAKTVSF